MVGPLNPVHSGFDAGKWSARMWGNTSHSLYSRACRTLTNWIPSPLGPITRCAGSRRAGICKTDATSKRLIPFVFNSSDSNQSYVLEFGNLYVRFYRGGDSHALVVDEDNGDATVELVTPFRTVDLPYIDYTQNGDLIYLVDGVHVPQIITRTGPDHWDWTIEDFTDIVDEPWNTARNKTRFRLHDLTVQSSGAPFGSADAVYSGAYGTGTAHLPATRKEMDSFFSVTYETLNGYWDDYITTYAIGTGIGNPYDGEPPSFMTNIRPAITRMGLWLDGQFRIPTTGRYSFGINNLEAADLIIGETDHLGNYGRPTLYNEGDPDEFSANKNFSLSSGWATFDLRWLTSGSGSFGCSVAWRKERSTDSDGVNRTIAGSNDVTITRQWFGNTLYEIQIDIDDGDPASPNTYSWKWREYAGDGSMRDLTTDTNWTGWIVGASGINCHTSSSALTDAEYFLDLTFDATTGYADADVINLYVGYDVMKKNVIQQSAEETAMASDLYPWFVDQFENRLIFLGSNTYPRTVWMSKTGEYGIFTIGALANEALELTLNFPRVDQIRGSSVDDDFLVFTMGPVIKIDSEGQVVAPDDVGQHKQPLYGAAWVDQILVDKYTCFVDGTNKRIRLIGYEYEDNRYIGDDITLFADDLFSVDIVEVAYQQGALITPDNQTIDVIWCLDSSGNLFGCTFSWRMKVIAWFETDFGGTVKSIAVIPGTNGQELWVAIERNSTVYMEYYDPSVPPCVGIVPVTSGDADNDLEYEYSGGTLTFQCAAFPSLYCVLLKDNSGTLDPLTGTSEEHTYVTLLASGIGMVSGLSSDPGTFSVGHVFLCEATPLFTEVAGGSNTSMHLKKRFPVCGAMVLNAKNVKLNRATLAANTSVTVPAWRRGNGTGWSVDPVITITHEAVDEATVVQVGGRMIVAR